MEELWDLLESGREGTGTVPPNRWLREHVPSACKNRGIVGGFIQHPIDEFDAKFFGTSPKDAEFLDPQMRLLLEVTYEALEDAMMTMDMVRGSRAGIFVGSWLNDYRDMCSSTSEDFFRIYMGNSLAGEGARLAHFLQTTGPTIATESGCSSAMVTVDMACKSLRGGECSMALACGVNLLLRPFDYNTISVVLSRDGRCRAFDAAADGFGRAEGCGVLILKRLSDAVREQDNIWGLIRGSALTQEGTSRNLGTPTVHCESLAMELALADANVDPADVSFVEAHGTGTPVGDPVEIAAITKVYSTPARRDPLIIGSVKTNLGHTESVSGITGIIKVLLSLRNERIPRHLYLTNLNPAISLDAIPALIPTVTVQWPRDSSKPRIAGVSSFGFSGTDGHAIIQEPPLVYLPRVEFIEERPLHIMKVSAASHESLAMLLATFQDDFSKRVLNDLEFANVAFCQNTGRGDFQHRAVVVAENFTKAGNILRQQTFRSRQESATAAGGGGEFQGLCFLFPGQGSQYPGMARTLYGTSPVFRIHFDQCDQLLASNYGLNIREALWGSTGVELSRTLYCHPAIFVIEYCLLKLWESWGVKPDHVVGHSLGEFAAAVAASILDLEDALMLVAERSKLIEGLQGGRMLVVKASKLKVGEMLEKFKTVARDGFWLDYAAYNTSHQTVVAGDSCFVHDFSRFCEVHLIKSVVLDSSHAFHSRHMDPILEAYRKVTSKVKSGLSGSCPNAPTFISGLEGKVLDRGGINGGYWVRHARQPVNFIEACAASETEGCSLFLEIGAHPILSAMVMANSSRGEAICCLPSLRKQEAEWNTLLDSLARLYVSNWRGQVDWKGFDDCYNRTRVNCLPRYPFSRKSIWKEVDAGHPEIHPLVGRFIPTASRERVYEKRMTSKNITFAEDHVIGNSVVFPGAGFLEMCLAGGCLSSCASSWSSVEHFAKPKKAVALHSLTIRAPLGLREKSCRVQITSAVEESADGELSYSLQVSRLVEEKGGTGTWVKHATANFTPFAGEASIEGPFSLDIPLVEDTWEKMEPTKFYERLPEVGLFFGPLFQSQQRGWRSEAGMLSLLKPIPVEKDNPDYLLHPVLGDAMLQSLLIWENWGKQGQNSKRLAVPVRIGELVLFRVASSASVPLYTFCRKGGAQKKHLESECFLVDGQGTPLARMRHVDFVDTSAALVEGLVSQQNHPMPKLWREKWQSFPGPLQASYRFIVSPEEHSPGLTICEKDLCLLRAMNELPPDELAAYQQLCLFTTHYFLLAVYDLGWSPPVGLRFSASDLAALLPNGAPHIRRYISFFLRAMAEVGILKVEEGNADVEDDAGAQLFYFNCAAPSQQQLRQSLECAKNDSLLTSRIDWRLTSQVGDCLPQILSGKMSALQVLFTKDPSKVDASQLYETMMTSFQPAISIMNETLVRPRVTAASKESCKGDPADGDLPVLRVLEIGAGTGSWSRVYLDFVESLGSPYEYHYTDVSAAFFISAEKEFEARRKNLIYKRFDMEHDPLAQGFCPAYFDIIVASEVLHVARYIKETLRNIRVLLKPGGLLQIMETIYPDPRPTFSFGLLEGYWKFEDVEFRRYHTTLTPPMWTEALGQAGFHDVHVIPLYNNVHGLILAVAEPNYRCQLEAIRSSKQDFWWVILYRRTDAALTQLLQSRLEQFNRSVVLIEKPDSCSEEGITELVHSRLPPTEDGKVIEGIVYLWALHCGESDPRDQSSISLPLVSLLQATSERNINPRVYVVTAGAMAVHGCDVSDPAAGTLGGIVRSLSNENSSCYCVHIDLEITDVGSQADHIFYSLWSSDHATKYVAFRQEARLCPRLVSAIVENHMPLDLPGGCDRFQLLLPESRLIADLEFANLDRYALSDGEVEVKLKCMGLNLVDLFSVLKPIPQFETINTVGVDFAGVVVKVGARVQRFKVGDRVMGIKPDPKVSLPSHIKIPEEMLVAIPESLTFSEAATLPIGFSTAVLCLIQAAGMRGGESVLIHTASGGVGLCTIQLARQLGASAIICTAGSERKRNYLRRSLGVQHVFNSRAADFGNKVHEVTNGEGVDIVVNSLTGEGFKEASLAALKIRGKFVEMSKLNVWSEEEVAQLRPDVLYQIVDFAQVTNTQIGDLLKCFHAYLRAGRVGPVAYQLFEAVNIRGALSYMQKARHIGKIICTMPDVRVENSRVVATTKMFNEESTYLVTGGLGGIGLEVVKWMLAKGAKHIVIASRNPPQSDVCKQIQAWNKSGKHVQAFQVDVGDYIQCEELFHKFGAGKDAGDGGLPQLRGIMHVAGVLSNGVIENQSWSKFQFTYNPKVSGSWNLHELSKGMLLEHFVLFSSFVSMLGSPGQSNHCASCSFEDCLASYRRSLGLPATTINWGNWGEVGVATDIDFPGLRPISTSQGILALETFLNTHTSHLAVLNIDSFASLSKGFPGVKNYIEDQRLFADDSAPSLTINSGEFWAQVNACEERDGKVECFKQMIKIILRNLLKLSAEERIDDLTDFHAVGIDSLMMLELRNGLQHVLAGKISLNAEQLKECSNTASLANRLVDSLLGSLDEEETELSEHALRTLMEEDAKLPDHMYPELSEPTPAPSDQVQVVLLTGATGTLGPYVLRQLCRRSHLQQIYCLVRPGPRGKSARQKLVERLRALDLLEQVDLNKVTIFEGDVAQDKLGISDQQLGELAARVDAIVHCAVNMDHLQKYYKAPTSRVTHVRNVNVGGTLRVLELACKGKLKQVLFASTILTMTGEDAAGDYSEDWQSIKAFSGMAVKCGYPASKLVSEELVRQGIERGIPCKVIRFPYISGDSKTGQCDYQTNHFILRWLTFLRLGRMPASLTPFFAVPVDQCAAISLEIFFNPEAPSDVYNIMQMRSDPEDESLIQVAQQEFGVTIQVLPFANFMEELRLPNEDQSPLAPFRELYEGEGTTFMNSFEGLDVQILKRCKDGKGKNFRMNHQKMERFGMSDESVGKDSLKDIMRRDLRYLHNLGVFHKLGIK